MTRSTHSWKVQLSWQDPVTGGMQNITQSLPLTIGRNSDENSLVVKSKVVSGRHVRLEQCADQLRLIDLSSKNGTIVAGERVVNDTLLLNRGKFRIGPYSFQARVVETKSDAKTLSGAQTHSPGETEGSRGADIRSSSTFSPATNIISPPTIQLPPSEDGLPSLFRAQIVPLQALAHLAAIETTTYLAIGGGLGSFAWVDHLLIAGADSAGIISIGFEPKPYGRYRRLCQNSQIPTHERLRSNSDSCPDNLWGWPGYAVREFVRDLSQAKLSAAAKIVWQLFNEPFAETYTPRAGDVYKAIDREARRIGWARIWRRGRVRSIRKTDDGRYVVAYSQMQSDQQSQHRFVVCDYLHLAVGYPGVRFLPDLQHYRQTTGDFRRVVNAYENHKHVYEDLANRGGVVLVRGRGIVASRIIQRLYELRSALGLPIGILHLMRAPMAVGSHYRLAKRRVRNHLEFQPFNWPKAAWGGDLRVSLDRAPDAERGEMLELLGGTTTVDRSDWRAIIKQGLQEGWYENLFGEIKSVSQHASNRLQLDIDTNNILQRRVVLFADFVIDATGLETNIDDNALLKDLVSQYDLPRNPKDRLRVNRHFELESLRNGNARAYASGISTLGGPYAPVDSFLGLQYAAQQSLADLTSERVPGLRRLSPWRSSVQWARWAMGVQP